MSAKTLLLLVLTLFCCLTDFIIGQSAPDAAGVAGPDQIETVPSVPDVSNYRCRKYGCTSRRAQICKFASDSTDIIRYIDQADTNGKCRCCFDKNTGRKAIRKMWSKARRDYNKTEKPEAGDDSENPDVLMVTTESTVNSLMTMADIPIAP